MTTLAMMLALLEPHYPPALISPHAADELRRVAALLPAALSRCVYFECRSGQPDDVDLIIDVETTGREILAGNNPRVRIDESLWMHGSWPRVQSFARQWSEAGAPLDALVAGAWLEFDLAARAHVPAPSVFVDFSIDVVRSDAIERRCDAVTFAAAALDAPLDSRTRETLRRCVAALPTSGMLLYAGFMLPRERSGVRLCIMGLGARELARYLGAIGWPGEMANLVDLTTFFAHDDTGGQPRPAIVHIDITEVVGASIGLEYPFARRPQLAGALEERAFVSALRIRGLLTSEECNALAAWPGIERRTMPHELWPSLLVRRVNHVKILMPHGTRPAAKVYLCAEYSREHGREQSAVARVASGK